MIRSEFMLFLVLALIFLANVPSYIRHGEKYRDVSMVERCLEGKAREPMTFQQIAQWLKK